MATSIPEGQALIEGRSSKTARALLEAAQKADVDVTLVRTTSTGYLVPVQVAEAYENSLNGGKKKASAKSRSAKTPAKSEERE